MKAIKYVVGAAVLCSATLGCGGSVDLGGGATSSTASSTGGGGATSAGGGGVTSGGGGATSAGGGGAAGSGETGGASGAGPAAVAGSHMISFDPTQSGADTCSATCDDTAGLVAMLPTTQEFYTAIIGRWRICGGGQGAFGGAPSDVVGVEYAEPTVVDIPNYGQFLRGDMFYLVDSPDGPVHGAGFDYQLTYDVSPQDPAEGPPVQLNMHPDPNSGFGGSFRYSPCPRQWQLSGGSANPAGKAILVPLE
jgi:hypothetical protein